MKLVIIESPYAGDVEKHTAYARRAVYDAITRGEAPIASHLHYTQEGILADDNPGERAMGIAAGVAWYRVAEACIVYTDLGISRGMEMGMARARLHNVPVIYRSLEDCE